MERVGNMKIEGNEHMERVGNMKMEGDLEREGT